MGKVDKSPESTPSLEPTSAGRSTQLYLEPSRAVRSRSYIASESSRVGVWVVRSRPELESVSSGVVLSRSSLDSESAGF